MKLNSKDKKLENWKTNAVTVNVQYFEFCKFLNNFLYSIFLLFSCYISYESIFFIYGVNILRIDVGN